MKIVAIIPARYKSTRFEGKPLAKIKGKPMIQHIYENAKRCEMLDEVYVATDDIRIASTVSVFGGNYIMTSVNHHTGTDRVAEAANSIDADIIVNIQGDEPMVNASMIRDVIAPLLDNITISVSNSITEIKNIGDYVDTAVVKTVMDKAGFLIYLTRLPIPYPKTRKSYIVYKQIGLYAFRKDFLHKFVTMEQTRLELIEEIEFLRIIENSYRIKGVITDRNTISVDSLSDLREVEKRLNESIATIS